MVGHAMDRGGLKDSENASNSFFPKINRTVFWDLGTDMLLYAFIGRTVRRRDAASLSNRLLPAEASKNP